jgi:hypothetical protein
MRCDVFIGHSRVPTGTSSVERAVAIEQLLDREGDLQREREREVMMTTTMVTNRQEELT